MPRIEMNDNSLCRIGVFYDGSYFTYARNYFYTNANSAGSSSGP